jgi:hypothetical protein
MGAAWQEGTTVNRSSLVAGACHADLAGPFAIPGAHSITVWFESSLNGAKSVAVPFAFAPYQGGQAGPGHIGISKN